MLKPFKQSVGFQEKHAVATLHQNQMRLPCLKIHLIGVVSFLFVHLKRYPKLKRTFFRMGIFLTQIKDFNIGVFKIGMAGDKIG
jgi:hypothetical protein